MIQWHNDLVHLYTHKKTGTVLYVPLLLGGYMLLLLGGYMPLLLGGTYWLVDMHGIPQAIASKNSVVCKDSVVSPVIKIGFS